MAEAANITMKKITHEARTIRRAEIAAFVEEKGSDATAANLAAHEYRTTISSVYTACRENGVAYKNKNQSTILRVVARLLIGEESCAEIGRRKTISCSRSYVSLIAKNAIRCRIPIHRRYKN